MVFKPLQDILDYLDIHNVNRIPNMSPSDPFAVVSIIMLVSVPVIALVVIGVISRRSAQSVIAGLAHDRRYRLLRKMARTSMLVRDVNSTWDECGIPIAPLTPLVPLNPVSYSFPASVPSRKPVPKVLFEGKPLRRGAALARSLPPIRETRRTVRFMALPPTPSSATPLLCSSNDPTIQNNGASDPAYEFIKVYDRWHAQRASPSIEMEFEHCKSNRRWSEVNQNLEMIPLKIEKKKKKNGKI